MDNDDDLSEGVAGAIEHGFSSLADAITPVESLGGRDAAGGHVASLTEAVMGVTAGLVRIAEAIESLASAVRSRD